MAIQKSRHADSKNNVKYLISEYLVPIYQLIISKCQIIALALESQNAYKPAEKPIKRKLHKCVNTVMYIYMYMFILCTCTGMMTQLCSLRLTNFRTLML